MRKLIELFQFFLQFHSSEWLLLRHGERPEHLSHRSELHEHLATVQRSVLPPSSKQFQLVLQFHCSQRLLLRGNRRI